MNELPAGPFIDQGPLEEEGAFEAALFGEPYLEERATDWHLEAPDSQELTEEAEQVRDFLLRTPGLTASEQAVLVGAAIENSRQQTGRGRGASRGARRTGGVDFSRIAQGIQQGLGLFQTGAQVAGGLAGAFGGDNRTAQTFAQWANRLGQGAGQVGGLLQGLRGGQIPGLPGGTTGAAPGGPGAVPLRPPTVAVQPTPSRPPPALGLAVPGPAPLDATALLGMLLTNPQIMQALTQAPFMSLPAARGVEVNVPSAGPVSIPLPDLVNTIAQLAQRSVGEVSESRTELDLASEDDPEIPDFLLTEDGELMADPTNPEDRAALVLHLLRLDGEARRHGSEDLYGEPDALGLFDEMSSEPVWEIDESDLWAREAGFDD